MLYSMEETEAKKQEKRKALNWRDRQLADTIKLFRRENDLTQEQLSEKLRVNLTYVSSVERYKRRVSLPVLYKISTVLKIKVKDLFTF